MKLVKVLVLLCLAALAYLLSGSELWQHMADKNWVANYTAQNGTAGIIAIMLFGALFTGLGGPRQLVSFTFGFVFGSIYGVGLSIISTLTGAIICYLLAQLLLRNTLQKRFAKRYASFQRFIGNQPFLKVLIVRMFPLGSNLLTNLLSGVASVPFGAFVAASLLGYLPQTIIFALAGSGIGSANQWQLITSIALGLISMLLTHYLYQRYKKTNATNVFSEQ